MSNFSSALGSAAYSFYLGAGHPALRLVDRLHQQENHEGDEQEVDHGLDEAAVQDLFLPIVIDKLVKSTLPMIMPMMGMMTSFTSEFTIAVNAVPMTTATARSNTLPRLMKSSNS